MSYSLFSAIIAFITQLVVLMYNQAHVFAVYSSNSYKRISNDVVIPGHWQAECGPHQRKARYRLRKPVKMHINIASVAGTYVGLTPARLATYKTVPAMSLSLPALLAGTLSNNEAKILSASPMAFILLGTTIHLVSIVWRRSGVLCNLHPGLTPTTLTYS